MTPLEIIQRCELDIRLIGDNARTVLGVPGRRWQRNHCSLCAGGPVGKVTSGIRGTDELLVAFSAIEVLEFIYYKFPRLCRENPKLKEKPG